MTKRPSEQDQRLRASTGTDDDHSSHNPKVAGSNPAPATNLKNQVKGRFPTGSRPSPLAEPGLCQRVVNTHPDANGRSDQLSTCAAACPARPASPQVQLTCAKPDGRTSGRNPDEARIPGVRRRSAARLQDTISGCSPSRRSVRVESGRPESGSSSRSWQSMSVDVGPCDQGSSGGYVSRSSMIHGLATTSRPSSWRPASSKCNSWVQMCCTAVRASRRQRSSGERA